MTFWQKWTRNEKRIYMIPTRFGAAMCFLFLFFTVTGAHYSNNLIFLFAFILVSFLLVAILQTAKNLRGLKVLEAQISAGFPEQSTAASLLVFNKRNLDKFGLRVQFRGQKNSVIVDEIFKKDNRWITHPFALPQKRGRFFTERVQVSTDAPYGLFYGWYYIYRKDSGVVYPHPKGQSFESKIPKNDGADFSGIKEYVEGDPIHRISWKHSAKRDELLLKEFRDETPTAEIYNIADCPQHGIEDRLSQMSLWICEAEKNHKSYGMILGEKKSSIGSGDTHMHSCLYELGVYEA
jgi:uncharacterized protein (DUF58 family)